jgi:transposase
MKFVATKTADRLDLQALHRVRDRLIGQRTSVINQIRAFLLERRIAVRQGLHSLQSELPGILATRADVLPPLLDHRRHPQWWWSVVVDAPWQLNRKPGLAGGGDSGDAR